MTRAHIRLCVSGSSCTGRFSTALTRQNRGVPDRAFDPDIAALPGHLDVGRLQSFMDPQPPPEVPMENQGRNELYVKEGISGMSVEY
jgi:hypothetical protein